MERKPRKKYRTQTDRYLKRLSYQERFRQRQIRDRIARELDILVV